MTRPELQIVARTPAPAAAAKPLTLAERITTIERTIHDLQLLAIATAVGNCVFSSADLLERARFDPDLQYVLGGAATPKQVGRRLVHLAAQPSTGIRLVRVLRAEEGCIWAVEIQPDAGLPLDAGA